MHPEAREFAHNVLAGRHFGTVVEVGGRDVNGRITDSFTCDRYISLDLEPGPNVDVVCDALEWSPEDTPDLVICMEVLEHEPRQRELIEHMLSWLGENGALLITAGGPGRPEHSAFDGGPLRDGERYKNLDPQTVIEIFQAEKLFPARVDYNAVAKDTYAFGVIPIGEPADIVNTWHGSPQYVPPVTKLQITEHTCPEDCGRVDGDRWRELHKLVEIAGSEPAQ